MAAVNKIKLKKNGFSLIEVLIAMFLFTVVGVAFLVALQYGIKANALDKAHTTAESLARSQIESIKAEAYLDFSLPVPSANRPNSTYEILTDIPANYTITITVEPVNATTGLVYSIATQNPDIQFIQDDGIQKISVLVMFSTGGSSLIWDATVAVEGYKVNR